MLFNSYEFVFLFLPLTLFGYWFAVRRIALGAALWWLVLASLFFYSWWNPVYLPLLLTSVVVNYLLGRVLARPGQWRRHVLIGGIALNLAALFYYKYTNFALGVFDSAFGTELNPPPIVLPLAISFFTFQQIAYLVDSYRGLTHEYSFSRYTLFVTFFPQLITGPIVHHAEVLPQFARRGGMAMRASGMLLGLTIFSVGLFKKIVLADGIAVHTNAIYRVAELGQDLDFFLAWAGGICYTLQLYFDFSGYSDMAVGLARMFGVRLPINFNSPLKARSISELWRRWHITLSRFLRDYVYISLGGNRQGAAHKYLNVFITFFLCGVWHGSGWTYVLYGAMQGTFVACNAAWSDLRKRLGWTAEVWWWDRMFAPLLTLAAWTFSIALFRSDSIDSAGHILGGMLGMNGAELPLHWVHALPRFAAVFEFAGVEFTSKTVQLTYPMLLWILVLGAVVLCTPNIYQITSRYRPALWEGTRGVSRIAWRASLAWTLATATLVILALVNMSNISQFLYFQF